MTMEDRPDVLSKFMKKEFDLWIWDWNNCLIDSSIYFGKRMNPQEIINKTDDELTHEFPGWVYFRDLVIELTREGRRVGIISLAKSDIIISYMRRIFGLNQHYFTANNILMPSLEDTQKTNGCYENKNKFIVKLMKLYRVNDPTKVIYFDDNSINTTEASGIGIVAVKVSGVADNQISSSGERHLFNQDIVSLVEQSYHTFDKDHNKLLEHLRMGRCYIDENNIFSSVGDRKVGLANIRKERQRDKLFQINVNEVEVIKPLDMCDGLLETEKSHETNRDTHYDMNEKSERFKTVGCSNCNNQKGLMAIVIFILLGIIIVWGINSCFNGI